ncbi:BlaI/MecI/CopY family transcriptional regulator [Tundrisphaera sp. TA3]|uniref:BlaI/MecI/CopY family transcriptional regulator n=1 Tax=Tundrisphaera sp. TA3 TaxID=3435775 RepID=UPI003EBEC353
MARSPSKQPTDGELEVLKILWKSGPAGLGQIHAAIQELRPAAMTTVATMLKTMHSKGLVAREDGPRGYAWSAVPTERATASGLVGKLVSHLFDGSTRRLVAHLIEDGALDDRERAEILDLLKRTEAGTAPKKPRAKGDDA